jgi:hypothetical protein
MAALQPMQAFWMSMIPGAANQSAYHLAPWQSFAWPFAQQMTEMAKAAQASSYAIYRSEGGHATAQVLFPGQSTPGWGNTRLPSERQRQDQNGRPLGAAASQAPDNTSDCIGGRSRGVAGARGVWSSSGAPPVPQGARPAGDLVGMVGT